MVIKMNVESGNYCELFGGFIEDALVNFKCPRAVRGGCLESPRCQNYGYAVFVDGVRK